MIKLDTKTIHRFLIKNFGHVDYKGCKYLAVFMSHYELGDKLEGAYNDTALELHTTPSAIARGIERYIDTINKEFTVEDLSRFFDYSFKTGTTRLTSLEFIPALSLYLENLDTNTTE